MPYQTTFQAGAKDFQVVLRLLSAVTATYKASLFDDTSLSFTLIDEAGHEIHGKESVVFEDNGDLAEYRRVSFGGVPPGMHTFMARAYGKGTLLEIPLVQIEGKFCKPEALQQLVLEQPGMITVKLVTDQGKAIDFHDMPRPKVALVELTDDGFRRSDQYSTKEPDLRIHQSLLQEGNLLSLNGYLPVDLGGLRQGDEIRLQKCPVLHIRVQPPTDQPEQFLFLLDLEAAPLADGKTSPVGLGETVATSQWTYEFSCPGKGEYQLHWYFFLDPSGTPGQRILHHKGRTVHLDPAKVDGEIAVEVPPEFVAEAIQLADH